MTEIWRYSITALTSLRLAAFALALSWALAFAAQASCIVESLKRIEVPLQDAAVELEMTMSDEVLALLTTPDGTVASLLKRNENIPAEFKKLARKRFPRIKDPLDVKWDDLSLEERRRLVKAVAKSREQDFGADRVFHGLKVRDSIRVRFDEPVEFMGKHYEPGEHVVPLEGFLMAKVEAKGEKSLRSASGVELHARNRLGAGRLSRDARTLQKGLGLKQGHQHVHVVAPHAVGAIPEDPILEAVVKADFARRANLVAEMTAIVADGRAIRSKVVDDIEYFGPFGYFDIDRVARYFVDTTHGKRHVLGDNLKMGFVGMHGAEKYDGSVPLWGLQIRGISKRTDTRLAAEFVDATEYAMHTGDYGLETSKVEKWLVRPREGRLTSISDQVAEQVAGAYYNQDWGRLYNRLPSELKSTFGGRAGRPAREAFETAAETHQEVKMLVFDWSRDPLVFGDPALQKRIVQQQKRAIKRLLNKDGTINEIMVDFLVDSGLYEVQASAYHLKVTLVP